MAGGGRCVVAFGAFFSIFLALVAGAPTATYADDVSPGASQITEHVCDPAQLVEGGKQWLDLVLKPEMKSIAFKCKEESIELKPDGNDVFTTEDCSDPKTLLSKACPGAQLERPAGAPKKFTLTVSPRPSEDRFFYYKCESQKPPTVQTRGSDTGVTQKDCIVKITVKGVSPATIVPPVHICDPKEQTDDSVNLKEVTLEADKQSIDFSCGNEAGAQLTPATSLKKFCADEGCQEQKELSSVWSDAALTTAGSGAATSYTLSIRSERKEDKNIYYKCSIPVKDPAEKPKDGADSMEKSCFLKITVKSDESSSAPAWMAVSSCLLGQIMLGLFCI
ncbi:SAG-related sequence [Besnoitia besnoiti]|uniref:SAG-related sequence n=1 Tax=Besnoitia besnoiti TaxID=94643 RepID=A0A2A9MMZ4_BESBE|nr:SAG-related sequence [Besnoitia besnoiti]PFH36962.1 SAG-related sequence [Besnoitia besnoiti]